MKKLYILMELMDDDFYIYMYLLLEIVEFVGINWWVEFLLVMLIVENVGIDLMI